MKKTFEWDGKKYDIEAMRLPEVHEFLRLDDEVTTNTEMTPLEQIDNTNRRLELLHCPVEIVDSIYAEQVIEVLQAVYLAHFGAGVEEGNPQGDE